MVQVGYGMTTVDFLATVDGYPKPDDKVRSESLKVEGGGNAGNALTCVARLGLKPRIISKVADDAHGFAILNELQADGVDTSFVVVRLIFSVSDFTCCFFVVDIPNLNVHASNTVFPVSRCMCDLLRDCFYFQGNNFFLLHLLIFVLFRYPRVVAQRFHMY